jgi:nucleotide-binding universal stress UspA family protein
MKKILLPIDGSERSMKSIELVKSLYSPEDVDISIIMVRENLETIQSEMEFEVAKSEIKPILTLTANELLGYKVKQQAVFGRAGEEIVNYAEKNGINIIIMTKSTRSGWLSKIGSVTTHVVKYAKCIVMIVPEN